MEQALSLLQDILSSIAKGYDKFVSMLTVTQLMIAVAVLLCLLIALMIAYAARGRRLERMREKLDAAVRAGKAKARAEEEPAPVETPARYVPRDDAQAHAFALISRADKSFEAITRELDEEARKTHEMYQEQRARAYDMLKDARARADAIVAEAMRDAAAGTRPVAAEKAKPDDPYNLGSLDDLDEDK